MPRNKPYSEKRQDKNCDLVNMANALALLEAIEALAEQRNAGHYPVEDTDAMQALSEIDRIAGNAQSELFAKIEAAVSGEEY